MSFQRRASAFDLARRMAARFMGANGAGDDMAYVISQEYTPTLVFSGAATGSIVGPLGAGAFGVMRAGGGAGAPSAGDTVYVFGEFTCDGLVNGDTCDIELPFEIGLGVYPGIRVLVAAGYDITTSVGLLSTTVMRITFGVAGADVGGEVDIEVTYQTENAIDP